MKRPDLGDGARDPRRPRQHLTPSLVYRGATARRRREASAGAAQLEQGRPRGALPAAEDGPQVRHGGRGSYRRSPAGSPLVSLALMSSFRV